MKNKTVNSQSYAYLKSLLAPEVEVVGIEVKNKRLVATLNTIGSLSVSN